jgi:poly(3-hydroxybutyrate) depolymerase
LCYQGQINKKYGTKFNIPVTYYSQLIAVAYGASDSVRAKPKPPVRDSILKWAKALGCPATPASESDANGVHTETYCSSRAEVVYIAVDGLGHTWAGGKSLLPERMVGKTSDKIKATDVIWDFFQKHARFVADKNAVYLDFRNIN